MKRIRSLAMAALVTLGLAFLAIGPAAAHGPQPLPEVACDHTANAHSSIPAHASGHDHVPHDHGFGCVHLNPTANH